MNNFLVILLIPTLITLFISKTTKENAMFKIIIFTIVGTFLGKSIIDDINNSHSIDLCVYKVFIKYHLLTYYLVFINIISFITYGIDKYKSIKSKPRTSIKTLLYLALFGGSIGSYLACFIFRHKTNKIYFTLGIPLIMIVQFNVLIILNNI